MAPSRISFRALPHLNALKGFEAAARLGSFRRAADELCITHAAISHQIKQLEADLDCALFSREGRTVTLTGEGRLFYEYVRQGLEHLLTGADVIRRTVSDSELRIETYVTVAIRWLSRLLPKFRALHPDIPFSVNTRRTEWWFDEVNTDIAILYVERDLPKNLMERRLFDGVLFPVCSPKLLEKVNPILNPADILKLPLIEVSSAPSDWTCWLAAAGVTDVEIPRFQKVDTYALAVEMAIDGDGIAMLNGPFAETELNQRTLVRPVRLIASAPGRWSVIFRADHAKDRKVKTFVDWLLGEVGSGSD
ncbi:MAG: LysR family transcriptional regulator [Hyphomicrobiales bacterium]|nr:LysR family transcriptional regulator [Hyphomicrobiales bacterium]